MEVSCEQQNRSICTNVFDEGVTAIRTHSTKQLEEVLSKVGQCAIEAIEALDSEGNEDVLEVLLERIRLLYHGSHQSSQAAFSDRGEKFLQLMLSPDVTLNQSPLTMAINAGAAMKVYLLVRYVPIAIAWTAHESACCAVQTAAEMLKGPAGYRASEVLNAMLVGVIESKSPLAASLTERLLSSGAAVDTWAPSGLSVLMVASSTNQTQVMVMLMAGRKDPNSERPLQQVAVAGADLQLADAQGRTALMHAAMNNCAEAVRLLLTHGAQVTATDIANKNAADLCVPGSEVAQLLDGHICDPESMAAERAATFVVAEAGGHLGAGEQSMTTKEMSGRKAQTQKAALLPDDDTDKRDEEGSNAVAAFEESCRQKELDNKQETFSRCMTCTTIGANPAQPDALTITDASAPSEGEDTPRSTGCDSDGGGPWHVVETCAAQQLCWRASKSAGHLSHSGKSTDFTPAESQGQRSPESAMSTFKQFFYLRDCSAATQGPSSRTPDPSFAGCKSNMNCVEKGSQPKSVMPDGHTSMKGHASQLRSPFLTTWESGCLGADWNTCSATKEASLHNDQTAPTSRHPGAPSLGLVTDLAAQVVSLQKKIDTMEIRHEIDTHEAVLETVQQMEARLVHGCAHVAAQLTWNELHRTGLAALYCGVNQGRVHPDTLQAVTRQCVSGPARQASFPHMHQGPVPPPPPQRPPPSQLCPPPPGSLQPPPRMHLAPFAPSSAPPPPGLPPQPPPTTQVGAPARRLDVHSSPHRGPMSPLSQTHRTPSGAFSANAKPFSPLASEWNSPNSIWAMTDSHAVRALPPPAPRGSAREDGLGGRVPSAGVTSNVPDLRLPNSLPGSIADPGVMQHTGQL